VKRASAVYWPTAVTSNTVAYSFYWCSDNPRRAITLSCSQRGYPDWFGYCADYCECPTGRKCYI